MGMSQVQMAKLLRYQARQVSRWETGEWDIPHIVRSLVVLLERNKGEDLVQIAGILMENHDEIDAVSYTHLTLPTTPYV